MKTAITNLQTSDVAEPQDLKAAIRHAILSAPVGATMTRLALPTIAVLFAQTMVGVAETYYISRLGTDALTGVSVVFPIWMLMTMMSAGGMGGGVASAVARAIGSGRDSDADDLVLHAVVLAVVIGLTFTSAMWLLGQPLFAGLGLSGEALNQATAYGRWLFLGAVPIWIVNLVSAALRGAGNVKTPSLVTLAGSAILIPLSPLLIFGFGPLEGLGAIGAGLAVAGFYSIAALFLVWYLQTGRAGLLLKFRRVRWARFKDILGVGLVSSLAVVQLNLAVIVGTALVGHSGEAAIAGYGIGSRLEYLMLPVLFGIGSAVLMMVGTCIGAAQPDRAKRVAWVGATTVMSITGFVGIIMMIVPQLWLGVFTKDAAIIEAGSTYLRIVAPAYPAMALAFILSFVSQGTGRPQWTTFAGTVRLAIVAGLGWVSVYLFDGELYSVALAVAGGQVAAAGVSVFAERTKRVWPKD